MSQEAGSQSNKDVVLNYIDKVHSSLTGTIVILNRVWTLLVLFSFILIILCFGLVSTNSSSFSYGGLNLIVPFWIVISGGAWAIGILFIYMLSLENQREKLVKEIKDLYKSLEYEKDSMSWNGTGTLEIPNMMTIVVESIQFESYLDILLLVTFIIVFLIPIAAEIIACYKTIALLGPNGWIIASFSLLFLLIVVYLITYIHSASKESKTGNKAPVSSQPSGTS